MAPAWPPVLEVGGGRVAVPPDPVLAWFEESRLPRDIANSLFVRWLLFVRWSLVVLGSLRLRFWFGAGFWYRSDPEPKFDSEAAFGAPRLVSELGSVVDLEGELPFELVVAEP